jgi:hypothetical protein
VVLWLLMACKSDQNLNIHREAPKAEIRSPRDGDVVQKGLDALVAIGNVSDEPQTPETLGISWALDGGVVSTDRSDTDGSLRVPLNLEAMEAGDHTLDLTVSDDDGNVVTDTSVFSVLAAPQPPVVHITAPSDASEFAEASAITFTGSGSDPNDPPDSLTFAWSSSIDGPIAGATSAGGLSFVTASLTNGTHTIVLQATDTDGDTGSDAISVKVGDDKPPDDLDDAEPGEVIFSELMINPSVVDDEVGEWVELYNTGDTWLDIGGYSFHDLDFDQFTLLGPIPVGPHAYVMLCANLDPRVNGGVDCDAWFDREISGGLALANKPDEVVLTRPDNVEIDRLVYGDEWVDLTINGNTISLDPDHMNGSENDDFINWCASTSELPGGDHGTPGAANDPCP